MMVDAFLEDQANDGECFVSDRSYVLCDPAEVMLRWAPTNQWMQAESSELCQTNVQSYVMLHNDIDCFIVPQAWLQCYVFHHLDMLYMLFILWS